MSARCRTRRCARPSKNELQPHRRKMWCIPPQQSAAFVYPMEDVLAVYHRPYDPKRPVVCLDETFTQLIGETRAPLPPAPGQVARYDCIYVRPVSCADTPPGDRPKADGTASLFLAFEPLAGRRQVAVTTGRTRGDGARFVEQLLERRYRDAEKVVLVMDQLTTRSPASFYEVLPPEKAKRLAARLEIHHTPKHGSWLNLAEVELRVLARDLPERVADRPMLERQVAAWQRRRNDAQVKANWQFTTDDARIKLRKLYPTIDG